MKLGPIFYYLRVICQQFFLFIFIPLTLFVLSSCSSLKVPTWNSEIFQGHPIFAPELFLVKHSQLTHFFITNRYGDWALKELDIFTGKLYHKFFLCQKIPFTLGVIPRVAEFPKLRGQKIIVFGKENYYQQFQEDATHVVRYIGGLRIRTCGLDFLCQFENIVLAVDPKDSDFKHVYTRWDLIATRRVNWRELINYLETQWGIHLYSENLSKAITVVGTLDPQEVEREVFSSNRLLKPKKLHKIQTKLARYKEEFYQKILPTGIGDRPLLSYLAKRKREHLPTFVYLKDIDSWVEDFGIFPRCPFGNIEETN